MDGTRCAIRSIDSIGTDALAIDIETPDGFDALPGQFVKLSFDISESDAFETMDDLREIDEFDANELPDSFDEMDDPYVSRFFTISSPDVDDTFEITVTIEPTGTVGPILQNLAPNDSILVAGPFGTDYYENEEPAVILAGGPGIGAAVGIAETAVAADNSIAVVYLDESPIHEHRLDTLQETDATIAVVDDVESFDSAVETVIDALGADSQLFVYGFADFIDAATTTIEAAGGDARSAKIENFG